MVKRKLTIIWDDEAVESLKNIHAFIKLDSASAAQKVKKKIIETTRALNSFPEKFSREEYIKDKCYHSFALLSYKIIYRVTKTEIRIIQIFHTSRNPEDIIK